MPAVRRASIPMLLVVGFIFLGGVGFGAVAALTQPRKPDDVTKATTPEVTPPTEPEAKPEPPPAPPTVKAEPKSEPKKPEPPKTTTKPEPKKPEPKKPEPKKPEPPKVEMVSYEKQVLPIFKAKCNQCHGDPTIKGGLNLKTLGNAVMGGDTGAGAVAAKLDDSQIWVRINDTAVPMPPPGKEKLTDAEKKLVKDWILSGAK